MSKELLEDRICEVLESMEGGDSSSEDYESRTKVLKELYQLKLREDELEHEESKLNFEIQNKETYEQIDKERLKMESQNKETYEQIDKERLKMDKEDRAYHKKNDKIIEFTKIGVSAAGTLFSGITFMSLVKALQDIEQTGVPTSRIWQLIFKSTKLM